MVARSFYAFDSEALTVDASSPSMTQGSSIINNSSTPVGTVFTYTAGFPSELVHLEDTSGSADKLEDDQEGGHIITDGGSLVANGTMIEAESFHYLQQEDLFGNPVGPVVTVTVFSQGGKTSDVWGFSTDVPLIDGAIYEKTGGSNTGTAEYETFVPCFVAGTAIATSRGIRAVESLRPGDRVLTRDNGYQPLVWTGIKRLNREWLASCPHLQPVRIAADTFGAGCPEQDLWVSPQHRVLLRNSQCEITFGAREVLCAASFLTSKNGIRQVAVPQATYVHLMFEQHQVVLSNGLWTESFQPGAQLFETGSAETRREILAIFPELADSSQTPFPSARMVLKPHETALVLQ